MKWNIIADSSCDLFDVEGHNADISYSSVPFIINLEGMEYVDDDSMNTDNLVTAMKESKKASNSACPSPQAWLSRMKADECNVLVTISKNLSGSYNSAAIALEMFAENENSGKTAIVDCRATGPAAVLAVGKIVELIEKEIAFEEVISQTEEYIKGIHTVFALSCFDNLIKAGRMGKFSGILAASLDFRGVGIEEDGRIKFKSKVRGKKKMLEALVDDLRENGFNGGEIVISHCHNEVLAAKLCENMKALWQDAKITLMPTRGLNSYYAERGGLIVSYR